MIRGIFNLILFCNLVLLLGCKTTQIETSLLPAVPVLNANHKSIQERAKLVRTQSLAHSSRINAQTERIKTTINLAETPAMAIPEIEDAVADIQRSAEALQNECGNLDDIVSETIRVECEMAQVKIFLSESEKLDKEVIKLREENERLLSSATKTHQRIWMIASGVGGVIFFIGIAMVVMGMRKLGGTAVVMGLIMTSVGYFMAKYAFIVAIVGGVIFVGIFIFVARRYFLNRLALKDAVIATNLLKRNCSDWDDRKKDIGELQDPKSIKIIDEMRKNIVEKSR